MTMLDALIFSKIAWDTVAPQTISACFAHYGFQVQVELDPPIDQPNNDVEAENLIRHLNSAVFHNEVNLEEFMTVDDGLVTGEQLR